MLFCCQDCFMLSVSLGFWLQKNLFNKGMNRSDAIDGEYTARMVRTKHKKETQSVKENDKKNNDGDEKYGWIREQSEKLSTAIS